MNRLTNVLKNTSRRASPEHTLQRMMEALGKPHVIPTEDKYYVFVYQAKTPDLLYDQHPLIKCTSIQAWGFIGFNYHWKKFRRYTWAEVLTNVYEVKPDEFKTALKFNITRLKRVPR